MNAIATGTVLVVALTAMQCWGGGGNEAGNEARGRARAERPCPVVVVSDTVEAVASGSQVVVTAKKDTVPVPHRTCVSLYAQAKDTVWKP
jgi:hypothetical protein